MSKIKLTDTERLILANQYEILSELRKDEDYKLKAETLREGHEWLYSKEFDCLSPNLSDQDTKHVITIIGIYGDLSASYEKLTDKSEIDQNKVKFPGFDGNNESELLSFAKALLKHGCFTETLGEEVINSHAWTTDIYKRMIDRWRELDEPKYPYGKQTILDILEARIHPDSR